MYVKIIHINSRMLYSKHLNESNFNGITNIFLEFTKDYVKHDDS